MALQLFQEISGIFKSSLDIDIMASLGQEYFYVEAILIICSLTFLFKKP